MSPSHIRPPDSAASTTMDGLSVKSLEDIHEAIDPRLSLSSRPKAEDLDDTFIQRLSKRSSHPASTPQSGTSDGDPEKTLDLEEPFYVRSMILVVLHAFNACIQIDWETNDPRNPMHFPRRKKWAITALACISTLMSCTHHPLSS